MHGPHNMPAENLPSTEAPYLQTNISRLADLTLDRVQDEHPLLQETTTACHLCP